MSVIVYRVEDQYFASLGIAEATARSASLNDFAEGEDFVVERLSAPHATSAVVAAMLNGEPWAEGHVAVARYRAGEKVSPPSE